MTKEELQLYMKYKVISIEFNNHFGIDPLMFFNIKYKRHWWSRWRYIYDKRAKVPMLFDSPDEALEYAHSILESA